MESGIDISKWMKAGTRRFIFVLACSAVLASCSNYEAARRKAGSQLQFRMNEIDAQYEEGLIDETQKAELEKQAIEQHKIRWNKIDDPDEIYGPPLSPRDSATGYRGL